ncbi:MAG: hypothetical protein FWC97_01250 [Treponema sp.]|nr:hypothetical protein [Treponema sp.]
MKKNLFKSGIVSLLLVLALAISGCPAQPAEETGGNDPAAAPVITVQPVGAAFTVGAGVTVPALSVTATSPDGGTLTFQWFSGPNMAAAGGTAISGATGSSFSPTINTETPAFHHFYVVVTNTNPNRSPSVRTTASNVARISINPDNAGFNPGNANVTVTLNNQNAEGQPMGFFSGNRHQFVRGFGGNAQVEFRAGNGTPSPHMSNDETRLLHNPDWGFGFQILRHQMYDDIQDLVAGVPRTPPSPHAAFNFVHPDQGYYSGSNHNYLDQIRIVNSYGGYVIMVPWTAPAIFKGPTATSAPGQGSLVGNHWALRAQFGPLAQWYAWYLDWLWQNGAPIFAIGPQNEYNIEVGYEGMRFSNAHMAQFSLDYLYPAIRHIPGFGGGQQWDRVFIGSGERSGGGAATLNALLANHLPADSSHTISVTAGAAPSPFATANLGGGHNQMSGRVDAIWRHYYGEMHQRLNTLLEGTGSAAGLMHHPSAHHMEVWQTEHNDTTGANRAAFFTVMSTWNWVWHLANEIYAGLALNDESAWVWWYNKRFYSFIGDGSFGTTNGAVLPRAHVMSHFSRFAANTTRIGVTATGNFVENLGTAAGTAAGNNTILPVQSGETGATTTFNPTTFASGNNNQGGQNQATTKAMAFESMCGDEIVFIMFTPVNNDGTRGQNAGNVLINLPAGFAATNAYLMRSTSDVQSRLEPVAMNVAGTSAMINLPRNQIVSVRFTR